MKSFSNSAFFAFVFLILTVQTINASANPTSLKQLIDPKNLKDVEIIERKTTPSETSITLRTRVGDLKGLKQIVFNEVRKAADPRKAARFSENNSSIGATVRQANTICDGPGYGAGAALSPMSLSLSPPDSSMCFNLNCGIPFTCYCQYGCGSFFNIKYCYYICGGIVKLIYSSLPGFSCNVLGSPLPAIAGSEPCPLQSAVPLCSA